MVIRKYYRFSTNTKLNAKSFSIPLSISHQSDLYATQDGKLFILLLLKK